jgi:hypothetical protein
MMVSDEKYKRNQTEPDTADEVEELKAFVSTIRQTSLLRLKLITKFSLGESYSIKCLKYYGFQFYEGLHIIIMTIIHTSFFDLFLLFRNHFIGIKYFEEDFVFKHQFALIDLFAGILYLALNFFGDKSINGTMRDFRFYLGQKSKERNP